jgi:chemotaxis protein MotB
MLVQRSILGFSLLMLTGCQTIGGESMPTLTRTGEVKDVIIREGVEPSSVTVSPGDEIRWINKRQGAVRVIFLTHMTENLACQRHFGGFGTKRNEYSAKLSPNKTASVCFREAGEVKYVVRAESSGSSGEQNLAGTISIGPQYASSRPGVKTVERKERLAAQSHKTDEAASSDMTLRLAAADRDRQQLVDELAVAQGQLADRDASLTSLRSQLDHSLAAQSEQVEATSDMSSRLAAADRDRQRLVDELAVAQGQLANRDASLTSLRSQVDHSLAVQSERDEAASDMSSRLAAADRDRQQLVDELAVAQGQLADRDASLTSLRSQLDHNKSNLANAERDLLKALQPEISKGTVLVQQSSNALTINLDSSLLFDSGQDRMRADASDTLKRVGTVLKDFPEKQVRVAGYTDNVAIKGDLQKKFPSNKELSDARANTAAQALRDGGVSANLWAAGHGDSNPIASNTTATGRAKNRRVEIMVTS